MFIRVAVIEGKERERKASTHLLQSFNDDILLSRLSNGRNPGHITVT